MVTRRIFLKAGGIALFSLGAGPKFLTRTALAATGPGPARRRKVLVTIFQRGAMDGLAAVPPVDAATLQGLRPRLALSATRAAAATEAGGLIDLGVGFGLHPALAPLQPLWQEKRLAIVHAVGSPDPTRSHFDAQDFMESGTPGRKGTPTGWLNRAVGLLGHEGTPLRAVSITPSLPRSLYGDQPAIAVTNLNDFKLRLPGADRAATAAAGEGFEALYGQAAQGLLHNTANETFEAVDLLSAAQIANYRPAPGADYPQSPLGQALRQIALLIKANVGLEVAFAESGGWDTHVQQAGTFTRQANDLAKAIHAFWTDLGTYQDDVLLTTMTEFGRTVRENGSGGTDHGHGSCLFVVGNHVLGGKVHGEFPGLAQGALYEGRDLPVTTDFRAVFCELAGKQLNIQKDDALFPGWSGKRLRLLA
jgi:uncharacterized protein (DUF1501 family)